MTLRRKHRRQSSLGMSIRSDGKQESRRRRSSYTSSSWIRDADDEADELSTRTGRSRPCSWGPIGEFFYRDSLSFCDSERSPMSHHECNFQNMRNPFAPNKNALQCNCTNETLTQNFRNRTLQRTILMKLDLFGSRTIFALTASSGVNSFKSKSKSNVTSTAAMCTV